MTIEGTAEAEPINTSDDVETVETSLEDELSQYLDEEGTGDGTPDLADVEYDGKSYKVAPELKDALLRQSDYTRKTMELADERRSLDSQKQAYEQLTSVSGERKQAEIARESANAAIEQLMQTPIDGLSQEQVNNLQLQLIMAQRAADQWTAKAAELSQQEQQSLGQQFAKAQTDAITEAAKRIPNFTDQRRAELDSFVQKIGGQAGSVKQLADPTAWQIVHLAEIGHKVLERQRQAKNVTAAQDVQPAAQVGGKSAATKKDLVRDADSMTTEEWLARRNEQVR